MEASPAIGQASREQAFEALKARVVTRSFGIRIGGFGLDYTSKKVTVDPDEKAKQSGRDTRGQEFATEMDRERLRQMLYDTPWSGSAQAGQSSQASSHPDPAWRRGLTAYARARDMLRADAARASGTTLAVA